MHSPQAEHSPPKPSTSAWLDLLCWATQGTARGRSPARHLGGKTHAGAREAGRVSTQKQAKPFVLHTSCVSFSAPSTSDARDDSKLTPDAPLQGLSLVLLVTVRSAPASPSHLCTVPPARSPPLPAYCAQRRSLYPTNCGCFTQSCWRDGLTVMFAWDHRGSHSLALAPHGLLCGLTALL